MTTIFIQYVKCPVCHSYYGIRSDQSLEGCRIRTCKAKVTLLKVRNIPGWKSVLHGRTLDNSQRVDPRVRWRRRKPPTSRYFPKQKDTKFQPAEFRESYGPEPELLKPDPSGTPIAGHSVTPIKQASGMKGSTIFWTITLLTAFGLAIANLLSPNLVTNLVSSIIGGSNTSCAKVNSFISEIHSCSSSHNGVTRSGSKWCEYTMKQAGSDWSLNGTNMAMGTYGEGWIPNSCIH